MFGRRRNLLRRLGLWLGRDSQALRGLRRRRRALHMRPGGANPREHRYNLLKLVKRRCDARRRHHSAGNRIKTVQISRCFAAVLEIQHALQPPVMVSAWFSELTRFSICPTPIAAIAPPLSKKSGASTAIPSRTLRTSTSTTSAAKSTRVPTTPLIRTVRGVSHQIGGNHCAG
jgi:hypothetical protein